MIPTSITQHIHQLPFYICIKVYHNVRFANKVPVEEIQKNDMRESAVLFVLKEAELIKSDCRRQPSIARQNLYVSFWYQIENSVGCWL